jgi:hypothetical protein
MKFAPSADAAVSVPRTWRRRALTKIAVAAVAGGAVSGALAPAALATARNVNFVGVWKPNTGIGWTIKSENRKTGACTGVTALASSGYDLVDCQVHGHKYSFTVTYGSGYKSVNTGVIVANRLVGKFKDTNGTVEAYTAKRARKRA